MADPATWMTIATVVSAGGSLYSGYQAQKSSAAEAALQEEQGRLADLEARRAATQTEEEARKFRDRQILAYVKSGVTLAGSPLQVLEETIRKGDEEADALRKRGSAQRNLSNQSADITRSTGRAQFISGIVGATGTVGTNYAVGRTAGIYKK